MRLLFDKKHYRKAVQLLVMILLGIQFSARVHAADDVEEFTVFRGTHGELSANTEMETVDGQYYDLTRRAKMADPSKDVYQNTIALKVLEGGGVFVGQDFAFTVTFDVWWTDKNTNTEQGPQRLSLTVDYKVGQGTKYDARSSYLFDNARKVRIKIFSVSGGLPANAIKLLQLENRLKVRRDYTFVQTAITFAAGTKTNNELAFSWTSDGTKGHTHFDIEWAWIDATARNRYGGSTLNADLVFKNNSTRVTILGAVTGISAGTSSYKIPLFYDDAGYLCYRIRPVQYAEDGNIYEGQWSTLKEFEDNGFETSLNWQSTTTFAEDGKRKSVVQFFDGTLRSRQTVTKLKDEKMVELAPNDYETAVVAETMYDYQGRPTINILPAPTLNAAIRFAKDFNRFVATDYPKDLYDKLIDGTSLCETKTPILDSTTGSSQYYSSNNPLSDSRFHQYIPSAHGFPFTETQYTPDGTGRIAVQGGVGAMFQINNKINGELSSKETRYYYGSAEQKELDALFGTEAGNAEHYFKNMVRDANGQYSVSYVDMHGRTVATALAGSKPANMDDAGQKTQYMTRSLLNAGNNLVKGKSIISSSTLLVTKNSVHEFRYELGPQSADILACNPEGQSVCYECKYDLEIRITADCLETPIVKTYNEISFPLSTDCPTEASGIVLTFNEALSEGEYNITKTLTLSKAAQDWYRENVFKEKNICKTLQDYFDQQYSIMIANSDCNTEYTCAACTTALGTAEQFRTKFLQEQGITDPNTVVEYEAEIRQAYQEAQEACAALCSANSNTVESKLDLIYSMMLEDMIPGRGQYALLDEDLNGNGSLNDVIDVTNGESGQLPGILNPAQPRFETNSTRPFSIFKAIGTPSYKPYTLPRDANGNPLPYYPGEQAGQPDQELSPNPPTGLTTDEFGTFAASFREEWAENLVYYHPEYQRYAFAKDKLTASYARDAQMLSIQTWDAATPEFITNLITNDPFFSGTEGAKASNSGTSYKDLMIGYLTDHYKESNKTLWQLAWIAGNCPDPVSQACLDKPSQTPPFTFPAGCASDKNKTWLVFRNMFIAAKEDLINEYLDKYAPSADYVKIRNEHYQRRFGSVLEMNGMEASSYVSTTGGNDVDPGDLEDAMQPFYEATCDGYISSWIQRLSACPQLADRQDVMEEIAANMKLVCLKGIDADHPMGSSTVKPGLGYAPSSFEEVIKAAFIKYGINTDEVCHPFMVDFPPPYDKQPPLADDVVLTQQDECACARLTTLEAERSQAGYTGTLSQYIQYQHGVTVRQSLLDSLIAGCTSGCKFYDAEVAIPAILSCTPTGATISTCIDCQEYSRLKTEFQTGYPSFASIVENPGENEEQVNRNIMFQQFMNARTGMGKTWMDYLQFEKVCASYDSLWSCNKLDSIVAAYYLTHDSNQYGAACQASFVAYFNSAFSTAFSFTQIQNLFQEHCGHLPDVCRAELTCPVFKQVVDSFYVRYGPSVRVNGSCQTLFESHFNNWFGTDYTFAQLQLLYNQLCGGALDVCSQIDCGKLQEVINSWTGCHKANQLDDDCEGDWVTYFNGMMSTSFTSIQIDSLYRNCGISIQPCRPAVTCKTLNGLLFSYQNAGGEACRNSGLDSLSSDFCNDCFVWYVNDNVGTNYNLDQLKALYRNNCGTNLQLCNTVMNCEVLTEFVNMHLASMAASPDPVNCESIFTAGFNEYFYPQIGTVYTFEQIMAVYQRYCGRRPLICKSDAPVTCTRLQEVYQEFKLQYPQPSYYFGNNCQQAFTDFFNQQQGDTLTWFDIQAYYYSLCGQQLDICSQVLPADSCSAVQNFMARYSLQMSTVIMPKQACIDIYSRMFNKTFTSRSTYTYKDIERVMTGCGQSPPGCLGDNAPLTGSRVLDSRKAFYAYYYDGVPANTSQVFTEFFNRYYGTSFTGYDQLDQWAKDNFEVDLGFAIPLKPRIDRLRLRTAAVSIPPMPGNMPPRLCGSATLLPSFVQAPEDPCKFVEEMAYNVATEMYNNYVTQQLDNFDKTYAEKCLSVASQESFTVRSEVSEYHYTLYYYDQAGNLVQTVPPKGVNFANGETNVDDWYDQVKTARANGTDKTVAHTLVTRYLYNTLNQVVIQKSPDGGTSRFWYDRLGRLVLSQNAKQAAVAGSTKKYSYTKYDELGRITEVGQIAASSLIDTKNKLQLDGWFDSNDASREQITVTVYDLPGDLCGSPAVLCQQHLRNRVSYTYLKPTASYSANGAGYQSASYYTYDIHGNVDQLVQHYNEGVMQQATGNAFKRMVYKYDLVSGKTNEVAYQPGITDQFFHRYKYDSENKLIEVLTSRDSVYWERQATYNYYLHGPLARTVLGELQVQGLDYAYTLQGWIKGVNANALIRDMGQDGYNGSKVARDAYSYSLNYFVADYKAIATGKYPFIENTTDQFANLGSDNVNTGRNLFNGNISSMMVNIPSLGDTKLYGYRYDQLNRLKAMNTYTGLNATNNTFAGTASEDYKERVAYDPNGNIIDYFRNANGATPGMDNLHYNYYAGTNMLHWVDDAVTPVSHGDLGDQSSGNYVYDEIGNLVIDRSEGLEDLTPGNSNKPVIEWNVYGKISKITKTKSGVTTVIEYVYDASGSRIGQTVNKGVVITKTWYVKDAQGNVMAIYRKEGTADLQQAEVYLYGSSRVGVWNSNRVVEGGNWSVFTKQSMTQTNGRLSESWNRGNQQYELSNHLGNVLVAVSDRLLAVEQGLVSGAGNVDYYNADVVSANDYYPFGMLMPGRKLSGGYRYGFNGKEEDVEISGYGNQYDYGFRIYNPRVGRFLSVDPLSKSYPYYSPYQFAGNMPISAIDLDGLEQHVVIYYKDQNNKTTKIEVRAIFDNNGTILNQHVHKVGSTDESDIAKGNVLVFEIKNAGTKKEMMSVVESRNTINSELTKEERDIFNRKKILEKESGKEERLNYMENELYASQYFINAQTKTYKATFGFLNKKVVIGGVPVTPGKEVNLKLSYWGQNDIPMSEAIGNGQYADRYQEVIDEISKGIKGTDIKVTIKGFVLLGSSETLDSPVAKNGGACKCTYRELSQKRANLIKNGLIKAGVKESQIKTEVSPTGNTEQKITATFHQ